MADDHPTTPDPKQPSAWQAWADEGADMNQLDYLLTLSPIEHLRRHDQFLSLVRAVRRASIQYDGFDPRLPETHERLQG